MVRAVWLLFGLVLALGFAALVETTSVLETSILTIAIAIAVGVGLRAYKRRGTAVTDTGVVLTDEGVTRRLSDGRQESIRWDNLAWVDIVTTNDGPWFEDVFWLLGEADNTHGCCVPSGAPGMGDLLKRLQELPGFDNEAVIRAMGSTSKATFHAWRRM